jgi:hypothetical protein
MSRAGMHPSILETLDDEVPMEVGCNCVVYLDCTCCFRYEMQIILYCIIYNIICMQ